MTALDTGQAVAADGVEGWIQHDGWAVTPAKRLTVVVVSHWSMPAAIYEDSVGRFDTMISRERDYSWHRPAWIWRVSIRGVVFAGPLENLRARLRPDPEFDPSARRGNAVSSSWTYSRALLRRVGDQYVAETDDGEERGRVVVDDVDDVSLPAVENGDRIPTRRFGRPGASLFLELGEGSLTFEIDVAIRQDREQRDGMLTVSVDLAREQAVLRLRVGDETHESPPTPHLEAALPLVERALRAQDSTIVCCFNCAMSDYAHAGTGLTGMFCFRDSRDAYLAVRGKNEYVQLIPDAVTELVDELYVCPEFEKRVSGTGYRG